MQLHFFIKLESSASFNLNLDINIFISYLDFLETSIGNLSLLHIEQVLGLFFLVKLFSEIKLSSFLIFCLIS